MKVAVLTSSRADYSIYYPLLKRLQSDPFFSLSIIAFGTHLSKKHGNTIEKIRDDGFTIAHALNTYPGDDSPGAIVRSMGNTMSVFTPVWEGGDYDLVFCLGDRYEMFAACASSVPYNIRLGHIHGGETTLGAIDDAFRHSITHMSDYHFTAAAQYRNRVVELKGTERHVYNVGSLSIDNLKTLQLYDIAEFRKKVGIDLSKKSILITFQPETLSFEKNELYVNELISALEKVQDYQLIITMPNADTMGDMIRERLTRFIQGATNAIGVETLGTIGYLSCMKHCAFMLGNTSSGYIEASFFPKYVIDLGDRQTGRIVTPNIYRCGITMNEILDNISKFEMRSAHMPVIELYGKGDSAEQITSIIKGING